MKKLFSTSKLFMLLLGAFMISALTGGIISTAFNAPSAFVGVTCTMFALSIVMPSVKFNGMFIVFTQGICEKVQQSLNEILNGKAPSVLRTPIGYLDALISTQNTAGVEKVMVDPGTGKKKQVRIKFIQRGVSSDITTDPDGDCTVDIEKEPFEETVEVTKFIGTKWMGFDQTQMRKLCEPDSMFMEQVIRAEIDTLSVELNKALITEQAANFGNFLGGSSAAVAVPLLETVKKSPLYYGESLVMESFEDLGIRQRPIVVGAGNLAHYVRQVGIGCCNDEGVNLSQAGNMDFFRDRFVNSILGANHFIGLVPGYVQLLTWNKYVGEYREENATFSHTTITDPVTGLTFDMKWKYDDCAEKYVMRLTLNYELFFIPANSFAATDDYFGFNGSLHFRADADESCYC
jgi:hypothetical protein